MKLEDIEEEFKGESLRYSTFPFFVEKARERLNAVSPLILSPRTILADVEFTKKKSMGFVFIRKSGITIHMEYPYDDEKQLFHPHALIVFVRERKILRSFWFDY